jgi:hypothetical protein
VIPLKALYGPSASNQTPLLLSWISAWIGSGGFYPIIDKMLLANLAAA